MDKAWIKHGKSMEKENDILGNVIFFCNLFVVGY